MSGFEVNTDAMSAAASHVQQAAADIAGYLKELDGELAHMFGQWSGEGADAHARAHGRFDADARTVTAALQRLHEALVSTHTHYVLQENEQQGDGRSFAARINS